MLVSVDAQAVAKVVEDWTGIPVGRMVKDEVQAILTLEKTLGKRVVGQDHALAMIARRMQTSRAGLENPEQAHRRVHAVRALRRRQDGDGAGAGGGALRRRAEPHHHQHERVPGGAHRLDAEGLAARLRRLRRGRRADRGGAPKALLRRPARRGGEGAPGRPRDLLPGVRQGDDGRRRGPADRLQEHRHPAHHQRRLRADHGHVPRPGAQARPPRASPRRCARRC